MSLLDTALRGLRGHPRSSIQERRPQDTGDLITPSGMLAADLANETLAGLFARPGRMSLTVLGTVIGLAALVATLGLSRTAGNRIVGHFDELAATQVVISRSPTASADASALPWDAPERLARLNGVVAAGNMSTVNVGNRQVSTSPISDPTRQSELNLSVQAASPDLFSAVRAQLRSGRLLDEGNSQRADRVAVLGPSAAQKLGISGVEQLPAIRIGDDLYLVVGILDGVARQPGLLGAVIIPEGTAKRDFGLTSPELVVMETRIGAAKLISQQAALALRPDSPRGLKVAAPTEPQRARDRVQSDLSLLFLMLGGVSLLVGAGRDRSPACARRDAAPHRRPIPIGECGHGVYRWRHRRQHRHSRRRRGCRLPVMDACLGPACAVCRSTAGRTCGFDLRQLSSAPRGRHGARRRASDRYVNRSLP